MIAMSFAAFAVPSIAVGSWACATIALAIRVPCSAGVAVAASTENSPANATRSPAAGVRTAGPAASVPAGRDEVRHPGGEARVPVLPRAPRGRVERVDRRDRARLRDDDVRRVEHLVLVHVEEDAIVGAGGGRVGAGAAKGS